MRIVTVPFIVLLVGLSCHSARNAHESPDALTAENASAASVDSSRLAALVFRDSAAHARYCQPVPAGTDWRTVCTPKDQGVRRVMPKPPE